MPSQSSYSVATSNEVFAAEVPVPQTTAVPTVSACPNSNTGVLGVRATCGLGKQPQQQPINNNPFPAYTTPSSRESFFVPIAGLSEQDQVPCFCAGPSHGSHVRASVSLYFQGITGATPPAAILFCDDVPASVTLDLPPTYGQWVALIAGGSLIRVATIFDLIDALVVHDPIVLLSTVFGVLENQPLVRPECSFAMVGRFLASLFELCSMITDKVAVSLRAAAGGQPLSVVLPNLAAAMAASTARAGACAATDAAAASAIELLSHMFPEVKGLSKTGAARVVYWSLLTSLIVRGLPRHMDNGPVVKLMCLALVQNSVLRPTLEEVGIDGPLGTALLSISVYATWHIIAPDLDPTLDFDPANPPPNVVIPHATLSETATNFLASLKDILGDPAFGLQGVTRPLLDIVSTISFRNVGGAARDVRSIFEMMRLVFEAFASWFKTPAGNYTRAFEICEGLRAKMRDPLFPISPDVVQKFVDAEATLRVFYVAGVTPAQHRAILADFSSIAAELSARDLSKHENAQPVGIFIWGDAGAGKTTIANILLHMACEIVHRRTYTQDEEFVWDALIDYYDNYRMSQKLWLLNDATLTEDGKVAVIKNLLTFMGTNPVPLNGDMPHAKNLYTNIHGMAWTANMMNPLGAHLNSENTHAIARRFPFSICMKLRPGVPRDDRYSHVSFHYLYRDGLAHKFEHQPARAMDFREFIIRFRDDLENWAASGVGHTAAVHLDYATARRAEPNMRTVDYLLHMAAGGPGLDDHHAAPVRAESMITRYFMSFVRSPPDLAIDELIRGLPWEDSPEPDGQDTDDDTGTRSEHETDRFAVMGQEAKRSVDTDEVFLLYHGSNGYRFMAGTGTMGFGVDADAIAVAAHVVGNGTSLLGATSCTIELFRHNPYISTSRFCRNAAGGYDDTIRAANFLRLWALGHITVMVPQHSDAFALHTVLIKTVGDDPTFREQVSHNPDVITAQKMGRVMNVFTGLTIAYCAWILSRAARTALGLVLGFMGKSEDFEICPESSGPYFIQHKRGRNPKGRTVYTKATHASYNVTPQSGTVEHQRYEDELVTATLDHEHGMSVVYIIHLRGNTWMIPRHWVDFAFGLKADVDIVFSSSTGRVTYSRSRFFEVARFSPSDDCSDVMLFQLDMDLVRTSGLHTRIEDPPNDPFDAIVVCPKGEIRTRAEMSTNARCCTYKNPATGDKYVHETVLAYATNKDTMGWCGALVINAATNKVVGMHVAGVAERVGYALPLHKTLITFMVNPERFGYLGENTSVRMPGLWQSLVSLAPTIEAAVVNTTTIHTPVNGKTHLVQNTVGDAYHTQFFPGVSVHKPVVLGYNVLETDSDGDPSVVSHALVEQMAEWHHHTLRNPANPPILKQTFTAFAQHLARLAAERGVSPRILTLDEVIKGTGVMKRLDLTTSIGSSSIRAGGTKDQLITFLPDGSYNIHPELAAIFHNTIACLRSGQSIETLLKLPDRTYKMFLKDETLKDTVWADGVMRTKLARPVACAPLVMVLVQRAVFGWFYEFVTANPRTTMLGVGLVPGGHDWQELTAKYVRGVSPFDHKRYDRSITSENLEASQNVPAQVAETLGGPSDHILAMRTLAHDERYTLVAFAGRVIRMDGGLPSGRTGTSIVGGINGVATTSCAIELATEEHPDAQRAIAKAVGSSLITYGDDNMMASCMTDAQLSSMVAFLAEFGHEATSPSKNGPPRNIPISDPDATFIGRHFLLKGQDGHWPHRHLAKLNEGSFGRMLDYRQDDMSEKDYFHAVSPVLQHEAYAYGKDFYNRMQAFITETCRIKGWDVPTIYSWDAVGAATGTHTHLNPLFDTHSVEPNRESFAHLGLGENFVDYELRCEADIPGKLVGMAVENFAGAANDTITGAASTLLPLVTSTLAQHVPKAGPIGKLVQKASKYAKYFGFAAPYQPQGPDALAALGTGEFCADAVDPSVPLSMFQANNVCEGALSSSSLIESLAQRNVCMAIWPWTSSATQGTAIAQNMPLTPYLYSVTTGTPSGGGTFVAFHPGGMIGMPYWYWRATSVVVKIIVVAPATTTGRLCVGLASGVNLDSTIDLTSPEGSSSATAFLSMDISKSATGELELPWGVVQPYLRSSIASTNSPTAADPGEWGILNNSFMGSIKIQVLQPLRSLVSGTANASVMMFLSFKGLQFAMRDIERLRKFQVDGTLFTDFADEEEPRPEADMGYARETQTGKFQVVAPDDVVEGIDLPCAQFMDLLPSGDDLIASDRLSRYVLILKHTWNSSLSPVHITSLFDTLVSNNVNAVAIDYALWLQADVEVRLEVSPAVSTQGAAVLSVIPLYSMYRASPFVGPTEYTSFQHVVVLAGGPRALTLRIPYSALTAAYPIAGGDLAARRAGVGPGLVFAPLVALTNPSGGSNDAEVLVYARFVNPKLRVPVPVAQSDMSSANIGNEMSNAEPDPEPLTSLEQPKMDSNLYKLFMGEAVTNAVDLLHTMQPRPVTVGSTSAVSGANVSTYGRIIVPWHYNDEGSTQGVLAEPVAFVWVRGLFAMHRGSVVTSSYWWDEATTDPDAIRSPVNTKLLMSTLVEATSQSMSVSSTAYTALSSLNDPYERIGSGGHIVNHNLVPKITVRIPYFRQGLYTFLPPPRMGGTYVLARAPGAEYSKFTRYPGTWTNVTTSTTTVLVNLGVGDDYRVADYRPIPNLVLPTASLTYLRASDAEYV